MKQIQYTMYRDILLEGFELGQKTCRIGGNAFRTPDGKIHLSHGQLYLGGSDVFLEGSVMTSEDGGMTFGEAKPFAALPDTHENGIRTHYSLTPYYHKKSNTMYAIGRMTRYAGDRQPILSGKDLMPALTGTFDTEKLCFTGCERLTVPGLEEYDMVTFMEPFEEEDGSLLFPIYLRNGEKKTHDVVTARYELKGGTLIFRELGEILKREDLNRGICEPRLTKLGNKYYMTLRSDEIGMLTQSDDGLHFSAPEIWKWDDGEILASHNTQQAWVRHPEGLFLVYTRVTPHNHHIFRNRAPIFMARFDEERNCLVKETEVVVVPEMGARIGNFNVCQVKENEAWICVSEWMQTTGPDPYDSSVCYRYGARNRLWRTRIAW